MMQDRNTRSAITLSGVRVLLVGTHEPLSDGIAQTLAESGASVQRATWAALSIDPESPESAGAQFGDLPPFNVAIFQPEWLQVQSFLETSPDDWEQAVSSNIERTLWAAQGAAKAMIARHEPGRIIFISSVAILMPFVESSVLGTTLNTLAGMARMAAVTLGPHRITVNTIACGWVGAEWQQPHLERARARIEAGIPLGHVGSPSDVGHACCFLASELSRYVTGTILTVDGGFILTRS